MLNLKSRERLRRGRTHPTFHVLRCSLVHFTRGFNYHFNALDIRPHIASQPLYASVVYLPSTVVYLITPLKGTPVAKAKLIEADNIDVFSMGTKF